MEIFIVDQIKNFGYSVILGLIFGGIYDIIRIIQLSCGIVSFFGKDRGMKRGFVPFTVFAILDICFFLIGTVSFSVFLYAVNNGGFRSYLLAGVLIGMTVYHYTVGRIVMLFSESIVRFIRLVLNTVLVKPVRFIGGAAAWLGIWIWTHTAKCLIGIIKHRTQVLYTNRVMHRMDRAIMFAAGKGMAQREKKK